jgi:hypothetical protein
MSTQRKLNALLFELQSARNPLARAKVLARAWRTLRELSPTDRRLLARHAGFDGAQEILEGLANRSGGIAPAMLLQILANARNTDASAVSEVLEAVRDPKRRQEAVTRGVDLASGLFAEPEAEEPLEDLEDALGELQAVESEMDESPEEAIAALTALEGDDFIILPDGEEPPAPPEPSDSPPESEPATESPPPAAPAPKPAVRPEAPVEVKPRPPAPPSPAIDWSRWATPSEPHVGGDAGSGFFPPAPEIGTQDFDTSAVLGALGAEGSILSQLKVLRRELAGLAQGVAPRARRFFRIEFRNAPQAGGRVSRRLGPSPRPGCASGSRYPVPGR